MAALRPSHLPQPNELGSAHTLRNHHADELQGVVIIRIGFWGTLGYNHTKEPPQ